MTQESAIAPGDQGEGVTDEVDRRVAQRRRLPWLVGDTSTAEDDASDLTVARAAHATVNCLQHTSDPPALLEGQARVGRYGATKQGLEKALDSEKSVEAVKVERYQRGKGDAGPDAGQAQEMEKLSISGVMHEMDALLVDPGGGLRNGGRKVAVVWKDRRRGGKQHRAGVILRTPEDRGLSGVERWTDEEIATPSVSALGPSVPGGRTPDA